jgi:lysophospholipase L1-like esterase
VTFRDLVIDDRQRAGRPTGVVDLSEILAEGDYLEDRFHPNASGHRLIADACLRVLDEARSKVR